LDQNQVIHEKLSFAECPKHAYLRDSEFWL